MSKTLKEVIIEDVRGSFTDNIFVLGEWDGKPKTKYDLTVIFDKPEHEEVLSKLLAMEKKLVKGELKGEKPEKKKYCLRDDKRRGKKGNRPEYQGYWTLRAAEKSRPLVIDHNQNEIGMEDEVIYSGCRLNVKVSMWANDGAGGPVVGANLQAVQFAGHDTPFGEGKLSPEEAKKGFKKIAVKNGDPFGEKQAKKAKEDKKGKKGKKGKKD